jgi:hypothetical protein
MSRDRSVGIATGYGLDGRGSISGGGKRFFFTPHRPDRVWAAVRTSDTTQFNVVFYYLLSSEFCSNCYWKWYFVCRLDPPVTSPLTSPVVTMETKKVGQHRSFWITFYETYAEYIPVRMRFTLRWHVAFSEKIVYMDFK